MRPVRLRSSRKFWPSDFFALQPVAADHLAQRRQIVDLRAVIRRHQAAGARPLGGDSRAARLSAAIRLDGSARPVPAMSNAVPWSGEVRTNGRPSVTLTARVEGERLDRDQRLVVIHAQRRVVARARGGMEHGVGGERPARIDAFGRELRRPRAR